MRAKSRSLTAGLVAAVKIDISGSLGFLHFGISGKTGCSKLVRYGKSHLDSCQEKCLGCLAATFGAFCSMDTSRKTALQIDTHFRCR